PNPLLDLDLLWLQQRLSRRKLGGGELFGFAYQVEAAGDADEVFLGHRPVGDRQRRLQVWRYLGHLAVQFRVLGGEFIGVGGADVIDAGENDLVRPAGDALEHPGHILVAAAPKDDDHRVVRDVLADRPHHRIEAGGVVGPVDDDARIGADHLHAAG